MGVIKGANFFRKFKEGKRLTRKQAMLAKCYECNGEEEGGSDCNVDTCPMYAYQHYHIQSLRRHIRP